MSRPYAVKAAFNLGTVIFLTAASSSDSTAAAAGASSTRARFGGGAAGSGEAGRFGASALRLPDEVCLLMRDGTRRRDALQRSAGCTAKQGEALIWL